LDRFNIINFKMRFFLIFNIFNFENQKKEILTMLLYKRIKIIFKTDHKLFF